MSHAFLVSKIKGKWFLKTHYFVSSINIKILFYESFIAKLSVFIDTTYSLIFNLFVLYCNELTMVYFFVYLNDLFYATCCDL